MFARETSSVRRTHRAVPRVGATGRVIRARNSRSDTIPLRWALWVAVIGLVALLLGMTSAPVRAQAPTSPPLNPEDLRPLRATPMEVSGGRQLAQRFCVDCHGPEGIATIDDIPHMAGQRAPYLYSEMRAFLSGARGNDTMNGAITYLSTGAMSNVAAYYASLPPPPPAAGAAPPEVDAEQAGRAASAACAGCHGETGVSKMPGIPSLTGLEPKYLLQAMLDYKRGTRKNDTMKAMVATLPDTTLDHIALYYALQKPARAATPAPGNAAAGQALSAPCAACHGAEGVSGNPASPSLAGQDAQYLAAALAAYREGSRANNTMKALIATVSDTAAKDLAAFYASLTPQAVAVRKPLSTRELVARCDRCHGVNGNSTDPRMPALAGQREGYLTKVMNGYRAGTRHSPVMAAMMEGMSENDVTNLAAYYAHQKAQAVVYVPIPQQ